jgi:DNA primase
MPINGARLRKGLDPKPHPATVPALLKKADPWADYDDGARLLSAAIEKLGRTA